MSGVWGRIHSVETFGAVDGPGIRYVLFLQGCALRCLYCHNPDTWSLNGGNEITSDEVIGDVGNYLSFIKNGGFTVSGGEPLLQPEFTLALIRGVKELGLHTAVDTAGSVPLPKIKAIADEADLLLLDIKAAGRQLAKELTGAHCDNAIDILKYRESICRPVWIRHVLVPGYTLDEKQAVELANKLKGYSCIERVELIPFHKMGEFKWKNLGYDYKLYDTSAPSSESIRCFAEIIKSTGIKAVLK